MGGRWNKAFFSIRKSLSGLLLCVIVISTFGNALVQDNVPHAEAAVVTIDNSVSAAGTSHLVSGSQTVFINDQSGYRFYRDLSGSCVYSKTVDGGSSWGAAVTVDAQTDCTQVTVWYDKWTAGLADSNIHIATFDTSADDLFYNRLDTSVDTLLLGSAPVSMVSNSGQGGTFVAGANSVSITRGTDGTIYAASADASDSYVVECTTNCHLAASWTETGTNPLDVANDYNLLVPLNGGNIMLINRDISLDDIRSKVWNNASWSATWTTIDANATDNTTYDVGMAAAVGSSTPGTVYLAYLANNATLGTDDQVRGAKYSGGSWTAVTSPLTGTTLGLTNVAIGIDSATDDVYVAYTGRTTAGTAATGNVYWKWATSSMMNWSAQTGPVNASADDMYGLDINMANNERLYATWIDGTDDALFGDTIADVFPGVHASSSGTQTANANASSTNVYLGGKFLFYSTFGSHDLTGITLTEGGTIDGSLHMQNIRLLYETDTTAPYDCASVSYAGSESQFGSPDANGFSGANGVSSFTGTTIAVSTTQAVCMYAVADLNNLTPDGSTVDISIANPVTDVIITGSTASPATSQNISGTTAVLNDEPTQVHYHWRNDNGLETTATSRTGGTEDTSLNAMRQSSTTRLRIEVSNEGGSSTPAMQYRLEYALNPSTCDAATGWTDVGAAGGDFDMSASANLTEGADTTDIAVASGGVTDENTAFLTPNGGVREASSQTAGLVLSTTQYVELEYSIIASTTASEGNAYCFRLTDQGDPLFAYNQYPRASIAADVLVSIATSSQTATANLPATDLYVGSYFVITENVASRNVTGITIAENGSIDAEADLENIRILYDLDTTSPYNCAGETYAGTETQFGTTDTDGFSGPNGTSTFTGSAAISTTATMCVYVVVDTTATAQNGHVIDIVMTNPSSDVIITGGGSVSPSITRDLNGETTLVGSILTQTHYHWRSDTASESGSATLTSGAEDTPVTNISQTTPVRLRMQVSNEGAVVSAGRAFRLEYGTKVTSCDIVTSWTDVGENGGAWDMFDSSNLTEGADTTDIAVASGGVSNENTTLRTPNSAVKDTSSTIATTTLAATEFLEAEFSIQQTADAGFGTTYCFRIAATEVELNSYLIYPELTTSPERDFEIQRGTVTITGESVTLTAGVDYIAPSASTSAFIRITNSQHTGAGSTNGGTQNADDVTAYIVDPSNILTSVTIARPPAWFRNTRVSWEIVEFIGQPGSDNEMIVRSQSAVTYGTAAVNASGTAVAGVTDDADVVVFITGQLHPDTTDTNYNSGQSTAEWAANTNVPVFTRGDAGSDATIVSYAVVEFTGQNWFVQRSEHTYTSAGITETESITAVNSLSRTFLHAQKRIGNSLTGTDEYGHEVWLSSIGQVSYFIESGATTPSGQTSVAWIIENTQTTSGAMEVTRSNGNSSGGTEPLTLNVSIGKTLDDITNASIFVNNRAAETGTLYPRPMLSAAIVSATHYELWRSDTGAAVDYRTEIVEWPTAGLAIRQTHYHFFVDSGTLDPTDPWPVGSTNLGEDTILTAVDEPLGEGERIRIRMALQAQNATFPAETKAFRLQYAPLVTSCAAVSESSWVTLGNSASSTVWRGYNAPGTIDGTLLSGDPPTLGGLNLPLSDVAGTFEEENDTDVNAFAVQEGEEIEYDWLIEQNGAIADTYYCFRMIETNGTVLGSYLYYPQLRTASFTPRTQNWRWYNDETQITPSVALASENIAPVNIINGEIVKLRVTVKETKNIFRDDTRFKLQYSEHADFSNAFDLVATSTCTASSTWCYAEGAGVDNAVIPSAVLSDADSCAGGTGDGCGTHNESSSMLTGFRHENAAATEYEFTIRSAGPRVNRVYYFRLHDLVLGIPVQANTGESYPSLITEGASLVFEMQGISSGTVLEGVTLDIGTAPNAVPFGTVPPDSMIEGAHRLGIDTNGTEGYQVFMTMTSDLLSAGGAMVDQITGTNAAPVAWATGCAPSATSCFGYHTGDDTLYGGSTRFSAVDTYARISTTTLDEVGYSSQAINSDTVDVIFRIFIRQLQDAGNYEANIQYVSVPIF